MKKLFIASLVALVIVGVTVSCKKDTKTSSEDETAATNTTTTNPSCPSSSCIFPSTSFPVPTTGGPFLVFKFKFDSTQARLDNFGNPAITPTANAAFSPIFNGMSGHYIEMAQTDLTAVGAGAVLYKANETDCDNGEKAIAFCQSVVVKQDSVFFAIPFSQITPGTYKWLRVSLAYQNYDIAYKTGSCSGTQYGTVASFLGFNTFVTQYKIKNNTITPTASCTTHGTSGGGNVKQGYWGFESLVCGSYLYKVDGKSAATTVVNPNPSSPIPAGSCLVTGLFNTGGVNTPLTITGSESVNKVITVSLSTNKSFEWKEVTFDGYYQPEAGEFPVDMGVRGMIAKY
jgi:hypothetical protein